MRSNVLGWWVGAALFAVIAGGTGCAQEQAEVPPPAGPEETDVVEERAPVAPVRDGQSVAARLADLTVEARVKQALVEVPELRAFDFEPAVAAGQVTLRGAVQTPAQQEKALSVARSVEGVRGVTAALSVDGAPPPVSAKAPEVAASKPETASKPEAAQRAEVEPSPARPGPEAPASTFHTVRSGESLWMISNRYDVPVDRIKQLNDLRGNGLQPGQKLRVK